MSFHLFRTEPAPHDVARAPTRAASSRTRLSPKAVALGVVTGAFAAFLFAPDLSSVIAGDDPGIHSFFTSEASRRRVAPTQFVRPPPAPAAAPRARQMTVERPTPPTRVRAYAPLDFREPALDAIHNATNRAFVTGAGAKSARKPANPRARDVSVASAGWSPTGRRAVCVRMCDGYHFPLGAVRDTFDARAQAGMCQSLCPGAPARLYVMGAGSERIEDAVSLAGRRYDRLPVAFRHASTRDATCSCRAAGSSVDSPVMSLLDDLTLRRGDAVMTAQGVRVFRGATRWPLRQKDFVRLADTELPPSARAALATLDRLNSGARRARQAAREAATARIAPQAL